MTQAEKRKNIYDLIHNKIQNKKVSPKEWFAFQKELSKLLKDYMDTPQEPKVIIKEKIIYKKPKEDNYWGL